MNQCGMPHGVRWNVGIAVLHDNGLIELDGKHVRAAGLLRGVAA